MSDTKPTLQEVADGARMLYAPETRELARDLIAAQARIAELEAWRNTLFVELSDLAESLCGPLPPGRLNNELLSAISRNHSEWRQRCAAAESTIATLRELPGALASEADALESGAYAMTRGSYDQALDRGKAQAKRDAAEAIEAALSPPAKGGE